jgi:hypothetical protein
LIERTIRNGRYADALVIMPVVVIVALALIVVMIISVIVTMVISMLVAVVIPMLFLITRGIFVVVPVVIHKEYSLAASIVFVAVLLPMLLMAGRHVQVDGRTIHRASLNYHWPRIDHLWWRIAADVKLAKEAGLTDADRNSDIGRECWSGNGGSGYCCCN